MYTGKSSTHLLWESAREKRAGFSACVPDRPVKFTNGKTFARLVLLSLTETFRVWVSSKVSAHDYLKSGAL